MRRTTVRSSLHQSRVVFSADLDEQHVAFVDHDALTSDDETPVSALLLPQRPDAASRAVGAFAATARAAVEARTKAPPGRVAILGDGIVAALMRRMLPDARGSTDESLAAVLDASGEPELILQALKRLCDLGVLVLAGERRGPGPAVNLYRDIHRRGLTIVGVGHPATLATAADESATDSAPAAASGLLDAPTLLPAHLNHPVPATASWYRLTASA